MTDVRAILTDIEGTTTDIDFVHKVLFPYSRTQLPIFLSTPSNDPTIQQAIKDVWSTAEAEQLICLPQGMDSQAKLSAVCDVLIRWIDADRKHPALKMLQGKIWRLGYESGAFVSHLYPDVVPMLKRWQEQGKVMAVFSSGSVEAQKLLFAHTRLGDINSFFAAYFDTAIGPKRTPASYEEIAKQLGLPAAQIIFLSDTVEELDASREAGMQTILLDRNLDKKQSPHPVVNSFFELEI